MDSIKLNMSIVIWGSNDVCKHGPFEVGTVNQRFSSPETCVALG